MRPGSRTETLIVCTAAPPGGWRDAMVARPRTEGGWRYRELATGHDAMITAPRELVDLLQAAATGSPPPRP